MSRLTVVAYDIADDTRRRQAARICEQRMLRVPESVFEAWLTTAERDRLMEALRQVIELESDQIRLYPLALREGSRRTVVGAMPQALPTPDYYLI